MAFCDRHKGIIAYLTSVNLHHSSAALREELGDSIRVDDTTLKKYEGLLEKKWTSVVRLQKKVRRPSIPQAFLLLTRYSGIDYGFGSTMRFTPV
jgi:hypothetical protein